MTPEDMVEGDQNLPVYVLLRADSERIKADFNVVLVMNGGSHVCVNSLNHVCGIR